MGNESGKNRQIKILRWKTNSDNAIADRQYQIKANLVSFLPRRNKNGHAISDTKIRRKLQLSLTEPRWV